MSDGGRISVESESDGLSRTVWSDIEVMESKSMSDWVEFC